MHRKELLDPSWHKARVAARIWLKARQGRLLSARDKRLARLFAEDRAVENRLVEQGVAYWTAAHTLDHSLQLQPRVRHVVVSGN